MIISHDLGTTGNKATLVSNDGHLVASTTVNYPADFGAGGKVEQDPLDWWNAMVEATRLLLERSGRSGSDVDVISFSGQMMGVVPVDAHGDIVRPAIIWADTRSTRQAKTLVDRVGMERGYLISGHRLNATYSLSKMMWLRENYPDDYARVDTFLQAKDYVAFKLTGIMATDPSDASGTNAFDQSTGDWSDELLTAAGIDRSKLPSIIPSTQVVGSVTTDASRVVGVLAGTPVVIGGGDGPTAALGAGIIDSSSGAYAYLGSSSWVSVSADSPLHDPLMRSMTFNHVIPGRFVPTATMQAGGASLDWITQILSPGDPGRFDELLPQAAAAVAAAEGLYFLPHLLGERSPYWNPRARGAFVGLQLRHGRGEMMRAVLEGVAFNLYTGLRAFTENGIDISTIDAIGGGAHAAALLDIFADVWGLPVAARNLVDEANAIGGAVVGGIGVGIFNDWNVALGFSERTTRRLPDTARHENYGREYERFLDAYQRLEPWFESLDD